MVNTGKAHQYKGMTGPNEKSLETVDVIIQTWLLQNFAEILFHQLIKQMNPNVCELAATIYCSMQTIFLHAVSLASVTI